MTFFGETLLPEDEKEFNVIKKKYGSIRNYILAKCEQAGRRDEKDKLKKDPNAIVWNKEALFKVSQ